jgi:CBS-domain-containing membrane protein
LLEDIMSEDVVTINEKASIGQAAHILLRFRINGILIAKKTNKNKILGILTTTDLLRLLNKTLSAEHNRLAKLEKMARQPVMTIASKKIIKVQKDTKIEKVVAIIHRKDIHTIPVYEGNKLVGVVGRHDILNAVFMT